MKNEGLISKYKVLQILYESYGLRDAEKRIAELPIVSYSEKPNKCEDAISRHAVIDATTKYCVLYDLRELLADIETLPSINVAEKTGRWIMPVQDDGMSDPIYYQVRCSECGFTLDPQTWHQELYQYGADKYCPKCGAKMTESEE